MRNFLVGLLAGIFICISAFEIIHRTVEIAHVEGEPVCSVIYDKLSQKWEPGLVYKIKVIYKFFAFPTKEIMIYLTDEKPPRLVENIEGSGFFERRFKQRYIEIP